MWQLGPIITILSHVKLVTSSTKFPILRFNKKKLHNCTLLSVHSFISLKVDSNWHLGKQSLNCVRHIDWWWCSSSPQCSGPGPRHSWVFTSQCPDSTSRWSPLHCYTSTAATNLDSAKKNKPGIEQATNFSLQWLLSVCFIDSIATIELKWTICIVFQFPILVLLVLVRLAS